MSDIQESAQRASDAALALPLRTWGPGLLLVAAALIAGSHPLIRVAFQHGEIVGLDFDGEAAVPHAAFLKDARLVFSAV